MANVALLIAGGSGNRMHQDIPKQFITVNERPVIVYTLEAFENHPEIDALAVVCIQGWEQVLWAYAKQFNITKLKWVVSEGACPAPVDPVMPVTWISGSLSNEAIGSSASWIEVAKHPGLAICLALTILSLKASGRP